MKSVAEAIETLSKYARVNKGKLTGLRQLALSAKKIYNSHIEQLTVILDSNGLRTTVHSEVRIVIAEIPKTGTHVSLKLIKKASTDIQEPVRGFPTALPVGSTFIRLLNYWV